MTDQDLATLNAYEEAAGEPDEGVAAITRIVKNRMARHFFSDGTIAGTVLAKDQFSWAWFGFMDKTSGTLAPGKHIQAYIRRASTLEQAQAVVADLRAKVMPAAWLRVGRITSAALDGDYDGPLYDKLGDDAVSYVNPRILTKPPTWAIPAKFIVSIGHHDFYRA